jgi:AraC-like DNA-binding protein
MTDPLVKPTIPIDYLGEIATQVRRRRRGGPAGGRAVACALEAAQLPARALQTRGMRVSIAQFERFHAALVRATNDELFGFFSAPVPRGSYGVLVHLLTGSTDVTAMFDASSRFYRLFDRHAYWHLEVDRSAAQLTVLPRDEEQGQSIFFVHSMLLTPWRTAAWLSGRSLELDEIVLPRRFLRFRGETRYLFGCEPRFAGGPPRLALRAELARLPVIRRPDEAAGYVRSSLRQILLAPPGQSLERELRALLSATMPVADLGLAEVATAFGQARATLARRLARLGLSFQQIKDEVRRDHAIALLTETSLSIAEIAERVGYSAPSAFLRAFREWTQVTAGTLRRQSHRRAGPQGC